jgi:hypothetical protein
VRFGPRGRVEALIVRISRGRIRPGGEAQAFALLRDSVAGTGAHPDGLEAFVIARRMVEGRLELVAMTTWRDLQSMVRVMGPDWHAPSWLPGLRELVETSSVEHLETIAESFHGFGQIDPASVDLLAPTEPAVTPERRPPSDARPD